MIDINLLPVELKDDIAQAKSNKTALSYFRRSLFLLFSMALIFIAAYYFFGSLLQEYQAKQIIAKKQINRFGNLEELANKAIGKISKIQGIEASANTWSHVLSEINTITPSGVTIVSLKLDSNLKLRQTINGTAISKKQVAEYRDILEASKYFEFVDVDSTQSRGDSGETFTISFTLSKDSLK